MKLKNDDDVRIMFLILGQYSSKGLVKWDPSLVWLFEDILEILIQPRTYEIIFYLPHLFYVLDTITPMWNNVMHVHGLEANPEHLKGIWANPICLVRCSDVKENQNILCNLWK